LKSPGVGYLITHFEEFIKLPEAQAWGVVMN
jgi:hypothetical protein